MVAARAAGRPVRPLFLRTGAEAGGGQAVETTAGEAQLFGRLSGAQGALPEGVEHMADERGGVAMAELLMLFKDPHNTRRPWPHHPSFRRASLRSPSSKTGGAAREIPVLLTTKLVLFCSPRDTTI